jgi:hypothetical protein
MGRLPTSLANGLMLFNMACKKEDGLIDYEEVERLWLLNMNQK